MKSKTRRSKQAFEACANRLVAALPQRSRSRFLADCEPVELQFAAVLCVEGEPMQDVYFPTESVISLVTTLAEGARLEVGIIGNEGMLGTSILLGVNASPQHAVVQGGGSALRMSAAALRRHCQRDTDLRELMNSFVHVLMEQLAQTAACTRYHRVESRLARWLLMTRQRVGNDRFHLTHEFLAYMLGVRLAGVTHAACSPGSRVDRLSPRDDHGPRPARLTEGFVFLLRSRQPHLPAVAGAGSYRSQLTSDGGSSVSVAP